MELGQLEAFIAVAREGSFTRAAERLNLSQPSLSARIHHLEASLETQLFKRDERPVRLTPAGEIFLPYAERAVGVLDSGRAAVMGGLHGMAGIVSIGCPYSLATYLMPEVVNRFSQHYPQAALSIEVNHSRIVVSQLADGVVNLAFTAAFPQLLHQAQILLRLHDTLIAAAAPTHPLAGAPTLDVTTFWHQRVVLPGWGATFKALVEGLRQMSQEQGPLLHLPLAAALPMARQSNAVIFLPRRLAGPSGLVELHLPELSFPWDVVLLTRPGRSLTTLEEAFVAIVTAVWQSSKPVSE
jgi:DNA-binding transcriptional LysR family regulator